MKFKKILLSLLLCSLYNTTTSTYMFPINHDTNYQQEFEKFMNKAEYNKLYLQGLLALGITTFVGFSYFNDMVKENDLVITKYPDAQKWFDSIKIKYPEIHLEQKKFFYSNYKNTASFYSIYFSDDILKKIDDMYKKQSKNLELTVDEKQYLKKEEFRLVSQVGEIDNNCNVKKFITLTVYDFASTCAIIPFLKTYHPLGGACFDPYTFERSVNQFNFNYNILSIANCCIFFVLLGALSLHHKNITNEFACTHCDDECLEAMTLSLEHSLAFENNKNNETQLNLIKSELHRRKQHQTE